MLSYSEIRNNQLESHIHFLCRKIATLEEENERLRTRLLPEKVDTKILANIPDVTNSNPIAALINFGRHVLCTDVEFRAEADNQRQFVVTVWIRGLQLASARDSRKKPARELAAKAALRLLNDRPDIVLALVKSNELLSNANQHTRGPTPLQL